MKIIIIMRYNQSADIVVTLLQYSLFLYCNSLNRRRVEVTVADFLELTGNSYLRNQDVMRIFTGLVVVVAEKRALDTHKCMKLLSIFWMLKIAFCLCKPDVSNRCLFK